MRHALVEMTQNRIADLVAAGRPVGGVLVNGQGLNWALVLKAAGVPVCRWVRAADSTPAAVAEAFERSGLAVLMAADRKRAAAIAEYTTRPVISDLRSVGEDRSDTPACAAPADNPAMSRYGHFVGTVGPLFWPWPKKRLPDVTLIAVDCMNPDRAVQSLDLCLRGLEFGAVKLLSNRLPARLPAGVEFVEIPKLDLNGYNRFMLCEICQHVDTSHALNIHADSWVLRPDRWRAAWLKYDYIGAPWPAVPHAKYSTVGNSGFCLRSRSLLKHTASMLHEIREHETRRGQIVDDIFTCCDQYSALLHRGFAFAPCETAAEFAFETGNHLQSNSFGYHGRRTPFTHRLSTWTSYFAELIAHRGRLRLLLNIYHPANRRRAAELICALRQNRANSAIDEVIEITGRPTIGALMAEANRGARPNDVTILANADLALDDSIAHAHSIRQNEFWCLTRRDLIHAKWQLWNVPFAQDAWVWRGKCRINPESMDFPLGSLGCDNRLAWLARNAGYELANPSRTVRAKHLHFGPERSNTARIAGLYAHIWPSLIGQPARVAIVESTASTHQALPPGAQG